MTHLLLASVCLARTPVPSPTPSPTPTPTPIPTPAPATHWLGQSNSNWSGTNWASDASGTATTNTPTSTASITFSAVGATNQDPLTLDVDATVAVLTINDLVSITGDKTLTVTGNTTIDNGSLTLLSGTISNASGSIGNSVGSDGSVTVIGGNWTNSGAIRVGEAGNGTLQISEGTVSTNNALTLGRQTTGSGTITVSGGNLSVSQSLNVGGSGTGDLVISGGNVTNANALVGQGSTGQGDVTVSDGTWSNQLLSIGYAGTGNLLVDGGSVSATTARIGELSGGEGTVTVSSGSLSTSNNVIVGEAGSGVLTLAGTGEVSVNSGNGTVIIAQNSGSTGTLNIGIFGSSDNDDFAGTLNAAEVKGGLGTATLNFNQGGNKFAPKITGRTSVNVLGDGGITTLTSTENTYTGTTTVSSDRGLRIGDGGANGSIGTGNIINNGSLTVRSSLDLTLANAISGSGGLQQRGSGTTTLRGNSSYTGSTEVRTGTLKITGGGKVEGTGQINVRGGEDATLTVDGSGGGGLITATDDLSVGKSGEFGTLNVLNGGVFTAQYGYLGEAIKGTSVVTVDGAGSTLTFVDGAAMAFQGKEETTSVLTVTNGGTVNTAELLVNADEADGDDSTTATLTIASGGVVNVGNGTGLVSVGSDVDGGAGIVNIGTFGGNSTAGTLNASEIKGGGDSATLNFNQTDAINFAPKITGTVALNQLGNGTTNLSADSTYTGTTTVSAGALYVYGNNAAATGDVTVQNGGKLGGTGTIGGNITVQSGGTITTSPELPDTLTTSNLTLQDGSTALFRFGSTSNFDAIVGLPGSTLTAFGNVTLSLQLPFSYSGQIGDAFTIFDFGTINFGSTQFLVTSNLDSQFKWDLGRLFSNGTVKIASINPPSLPSTHWLGQSNNTWSGSNWASDASGTATTLAPTSTDSITFSATGAANQAPLTLDVDATVAALTINDLVSITGDKTLAVTGGTIVENGSLTLDGTVSLTNDLGVIGQNPGASGSVKVNGGSWANTTALYVGNGGDGTLEISGTGSVSSKLGVIGSFADSTGLAKVSGGSWTNTDELYVGNYGSGTLEISGTGSVSSKVGSIANFAGSTGLAKVSAGSWTNSEELHVGNAGNGTLELSGTGSVSSKIGTLGNLSGSTGLAKVSAGSWTNSEELHVGNAGSGTLELSGTGSVSTKLGTLGNAPLATGLAKVSGGTWTNSTDLHVGNAGNGTLELSGTGSVSSATGSVGNLSGSTGLAKVSAGSWTNSTALYVGNGGNGTLELSGTGSVSSQLGVLGSFAGATGLAKVSGGSWTNSAELYVGNFGTGTLEISGTGSVSSKVAALANFTGSTGLAKVSAGSWSNSEELHVGNAGSGTLEISGTGSVSSKIGTVGNLSGSTGLAKVSAGSWSNSSDLYVGNSGNGTLEISGTGSVSNADGFIANDAASTSVVRVTSGSWSNSGALAVGSKGNATLRVSGTGSVSSGSASIGTDAGARGVATITGGTWTNSGTLAVGQSGTGTLNIQNGGTVTVGTGTGLVTLASDAGSTGTLNLGVFGGINSTAGTLAASEVTGGAGTAILNFNQTSNTTFAPVISGGISLNQLGASTTTLTAANTHTGGTTISAGALQLGSGGVSGSLLGNVTNNASLIANRSDALTLSGVISGTGSFTQLGSGTTTFTAANTYAGGTTITAGTLRLGDGGTTGSVLGDITNNAAFAINRSDAFTFPGLISGSGSFTQLGSGTTTFTAANTYAGGTTISSGTLRLGDGGTTGSLLGDITNNAAFAINRSDAFTFPGLISGTGSFTQLGSGTTTLTAANTYAGGTTISSGVLRLGDGGTTGSLLGSVTNNASLVVNRSGSLTLSGIISGTGSLTQLGSGTTTLSASNSYTGGTTVSGGTLALGHATDTLADIGALIANAGTTIDLGTNSDTIGTYTSNGATLSGTGTLTATSYALNDGSLVQANLGPGDVTIAGAVRLNSSTGAGTVTILDQAVLRGVGMNLGGDLVVNTGGTYAPGASPGVSIINGDYVQNGTLTIELGGPGGPGAANGFDQITVNGTVTLGAGSVLDLQSFGGFTEPARGQSFDIFDGPSLAGQKFGTVTSSYGTGLVFDLATGILYGTGLTGLTGPGGSQNVDLTLLAGLSPSAQAIIASLQADAFAGDPLNGVQFDSSTGAGAFIQSLITNPDSAAAVNAVTPESFAAESAYAIRATRNYAAVAQTTAPLFETERYGLFAAATGTGASTDSSANQADYDLQSSGALFGGSLVVNPDLTVGAFVAVDSGNIRSTYRDADLDGHAYGLFAAYAVNQARTLRLTGDLSYGDYASDTSRRSSINGAPSARADGIDATALGLALGLSYDAIAKKEYGLTPYAGFNYARGSSDAFVETGPLDALAVGSIDHTSFQAVLGARGFLRVTEKLSLLGGLEFARELDDSDTDVSARFANGSTPFRANSPGFGDNAFSGTIGLRYAVTPRFGVHAGYTATSLEDGTDADSYSLGGSYQF